MVGRVRIQQIYSIWIKTNNKFKYFTWEYEIYSIKNLITKWYKEMKDFILYTCQI